MRFIFIRWFSSVSSIFCVIGSFARPDADHARCRIPIAAGAMPPNSARPIIGFDGSRRRGRIEKHKTRLNFKNLYDKLGVYDEGGVLIKAP